MWVETKKNSKNTKRRKMSVSDAKLRCSNIGDIWLKISKHQEFPGEISYLLGVKQGGTITQTCNYYMHNHFPSRSDSSEGQAKNTE